MARAFIGRRNELKALERAYSAECSQMIPVYGRRRVGKSELILHFARGKPCVYFLGKKAAASLQMREFLQGAAIALDEPLLAGAPAAGWKEVLDTVTSTWKRAGKLILVFDEFQRTVGASSELPSVLQELWDRRWKSSGNVLLILCGSYVGFMEREVLGRKSPLFGRRTAQIQLRPFSYREAADFHPRYSAVDRARAYFLCGGIPLYLSCLSDRESVERNIAANFLDEFATLYREPEFLLREELRETENYYAVLMAIASGCAANKEISRATGLDERALHYYLHQLVELGYVARRHPLTGAKPAQRHVRYTLDDPVLRFWFRFVYPNTSYILQMGADNALRNLVRPGLESYFGICFEQLCREAMPELYASQGLTAAFDVGEYWDRAVQIDVVGLRQDGWTDIGECKWGRVKSVHAAQEQLEDKVRAYPNPRNATIGRHLFVRTLPKRIPRRDRRAAWHDLAELYAARP
ncbi:MAG: ATP-binding protein [Kiritimatiellae bacterium]|nr:ATP-binding protein [Kiritimatiellia bacterium]